MGVLDTFLRPIFDTFTILQGILFNDTKQDGITLYTLLWHCHRKRAKQIYKYHYRL